MRRPFMSVRRHSAVLLAWSLASCSLAANIDEPGLEAAVKVMHLIQGADNAAIGFDSGRPLSAVVFPTVAPVDAGAYYFVAAGVPRQLRVLLTTATVLDTTVTLSANAFYTLVTTGTRGGAGAAAPAALVLRNNMAPVTGGNVRFRFVHGAVGTGAVDVHGIADSTTFVEGSRIATAVPFRGTSTIESRAAGNRILCVIAAGTVPTPNGSNCRALAAYGVAPGVVMTAALRDPLLPAETSLSILFTLDRTP